MNDDIKFEIVRNVLPHELKNLCINKEWCRFLRENSEYICKLMLMRCDVEYKDGGNFIYKMNNVDMSEYKEDDKWRYKSVLKLYMRYYDMEMIDCTDREITSFPMYPNMKEFSGGYNKLRFFPVQPKMVRFFGEHNKLRLFPVQPEMKEFHGAYNELKYFPVQPKMVYFDGFMNKFESDKRLMELLDVKRDELREIIERYSDEYISEYVSNIGYDSPYKFDDETNRRLRDAIEIMNKIIDVSVLIPINKIKEYKEDDDDEVRFIIEDLRRRLSEKIDILRSSHHRIALSIGVLTGRYEYIEEQY